MTRLHVVIIGSGFGGLFAAKALHDAPVDVTLIAETASHLFQPLLYQVATGILSTGEIAPATREILARQDNAQVLLGEVTAIDADARVVTSHAQDIETHTAYDQLIVAAGARTSYFGNDHFSEHALGMKSIDDALALRARIFTAFELAELTADPAERERLLTFVVVGAGPTGVEMAGQIVELSRRTLRHQFRSIDPTTSRVVLVDASDKVLGSFGDRLSDIARKRLQDMGIEVILGSAVTGVTEEAITLTAKDGAATTIRADVKVWAAGVRGAALGEVLASATGVTPDRGGRIEVEPDLTVPGHPEVFVVGDLMSRDRLPGVAQVAIQSGRYAAATIAARASGEPAPGPFRYRDKGSMATISRFSAIVSMGRLRFSGFPAWLAWLFLHLLYITGFKSRVTTLVHWFASFIGRGRAQRAVSERVLEPPG